MCSIDILQVARHPVWVIECETPIPAGFPSPAQDHLGPKVDLNKILLPHPDCTYLARVNGISMDGPPSHIPDGALLAIDCSLKPEHGNIVVAAIDGEFTLKRLEKRGRDYWLVPDNPNYQAIDLGALSHFEIWGVATHAVIELINGKLHEQVRTRRLS